MSIFTKEYWKSAVAELHSLKKLVLAALICALSIAISTFFIPVGENLRILFSFFVLAVGASVYGPVLAMLVGAADDTLGFILHGSGVYFPGYLLSSIVGGLVYALFLYRRQLTVLRIFGARFVVNYFVNVALGSVWSAMMFGKGYLYYLLKSLIKNSVLLPFEAILLCALFAALLPTLVRLKLVPEHTQAQIRALRVQRSAFLVFGVDFLVAAAAAIVCGTQLGARFGFHTDTLLLWLGVGCAVAGAALLILGAVYRKKSDT